MLYWNLHRPSTKIVHTDYRAYVECTQESLAKKSKPRLWATLLWHLWPRTRAAVDCIPERYPLHDCFCLAFRSAVSNIVDTQNAPQCLVKVSFPWHIKKVNTNNSSAYNYIGLRIFIILSANILSSRHLVDIVWWNVRGSCIQQLHLLQDSLTHIVPQSAVRRPRLLCLTSLHVER